MPGKFGKDASLDPEGWIGAAVEILCEQRHAFGMPKEIGVERFELFRRNRLVASPPHALVGQGVANGELVLGAAACEYAGVRAQGAIRGKHRFARSQGMLIKLRRTEIPVHAPEVF